MTEYRGLTYPTSWFLWNWQFYLWRKLMCRRHIHLFDEVLSGGGDSHEHYLHCDACGLAVHIAKIDDSYVVK